MPLDSANTFGTLIRLSYNDCSRAIRYNLVLTLKIGNVISTESYFSDYREDHCAVRQLHRTPNSFSISVALCAIKVSRLSPSNFFCRAFKSLAIKL